MLTQHYPSYIEEMRGLADGSGTDFASILALNARTEIGYGLATDGCTAFGWNSKSNAPDSDSSSSFLAQNWDWEAEQSPNIISLHITKPGVPAMHFMTEAGIIGKIGLNASGVGVTLNAIAARGVDVNRLPCHLALRTVLESPSREDAVRQLTERGIASSCHIQIADRTGGMGLENTAFDTVFMEQDNAGLICHSNHFVMQHSEECANKALPDSVDRLKRIQELLQKTVKEEPKMEDLQAMLMDEKGYPTAICRAPTKDSSLKTLFSVVMDLREGYAVAKMGRPTEGGQEIELRP
jgi:isopenicillin-N N-acyltransferase-like protein